MNSPAFRFFCIILLQQYVTCQVCQETKGIYQEVPETYRFTYIDTYEEPCIIFCSIKTRLAVNVTTRIVQRYENITMSVCCEGYTEDSSHESNGLFCKPICDPPCTNGYCRKPNQCACESGYALDPLDPNVCKPLCLEGCEIPTCIYTETPQCFSNNSSESTSNIALCTESCVNAICIGEDICQCLPGYHPISPTFCEETESNSHLCEDRSLFASDNCLCDPGWERKCGSCEPVCDECEHGTCLAPGDCQCNSGYNIENDEGKCKPLCSKGCANGKCVNPETCICDPGYYKDTEDGECKPHCDMNCDHGDCIAPNICECHVGYQLYLYKERSRCAPNRKYCKDSTSNPETCKCSAPYQVSYFRDDGSDCNCIGACQDSNNKCTKAGCIFMNVPLEDDSTPPILDYDYITDGEEDDEDDVTLTTDANFGETEAINPADEKETSIKIDNVQTTFQKVGKVILEEENKPKTVTDSKNARKKRELPIF